MADYPAEKVRDWFPVKMEQSPQRMRALSILIGVCVSASPWLSQAFDLPLSSKGNLSYTVDVCQFWEGDAKTRVEVYYSVPLDQFARQGGSRCELDVQITIVERGDGNPISVREKKTLELPEASEEESGCYYVDMESFRLDPGEADLEISIKDSARSMAGGVHTPLLVRYFGPEFSLSDVLFASHVQKADGPGNFVRHGFLIVPAVDRYFRVGQDSSWMWIYYEINNLSFSQDKDAMYTVGLWICDLSGRKVWEKARLSRRISSQNTARVEKVPLRMIPSGVHRFHLEVGDINGNKEVEVSGYFTVVNPNVETPDILPMGPEQEKQYYDQLKYVATAEELRIFESLDSRGKQRFVLDFYEKRDPDPSTPENEFMIEHLRRIAYCKAHFRGGVDSDMGRIYIKYGPPLEVERSFSSTEYSKPVEIWTYALNGKTEFVFVDRNGDGQYVLVHSTHPDEFANPSWKAEMNR